MLGEDDPEIDVSALRRAARRAERRLRVNAALRRLAVVLPVFFAAWAIGLGYVRLSGSDVRALNQLAFGVGLAGLTACGLVLARYWSGRSELAGALALDRHHATADRLTNALYFAGRPRAQRTELMQAALRDAVSVVRRPDPRAAVPLRTPRGAWVGALLALAPFAANSLAPSRAPLAIAEGPASPPADAASVAADDLDLVRDEANRLPTHTGDSELDQAVSRYNALIEELSQGEVSRRDLFRRMADIEASLGLPEAAATEEALARLSESLGESELSRPVADALKQRNLPEAEREMRELAKRLGQGEKAKRDLERLRRALEKASKASEGRVDRLEAARAELESQRRRLLSKKQPPQGGDPAASSPSSPDQLSRNRRQLERLERELSSARQARSNMTPLDRELAEAARELMKELGESARHLESGAEAMNEVARKQMTVEEKRELKRQLERLREIVRQGGGGKEHQERLRRFAERARGQKPGRPSDGEQGPGGGSPRVTLGPGGTPIPVPVPGGGARPGDGQSPAGGDSPGGGHRAGSESGSAIAGKPTELEGQTEDVSAAAVDTGQGPASSEVVYGAAGRGFTSPRYRDVYTQYRTVAEEVLDRDEIPAGYEFYVRRYFELIRPRGGSVEGR